MSTISHDARAQIIIYQRNEITEHHIYKRLAKTIKSPENRRVLEQIADDERAHYEQWKTYTEQDVKPDQLKIWFYTLVGRLFGFTFAVKLMERGEEGAQENYTKLATVVEMAETIAQEEHAHEDALLAMLDEEHLRYAGSMRMSSASRSAGYQHRPKMADRSLTHSLRR